MIVTTPKILTVHFFLALQKISGGRLTNLHYCIFGARIWEFFKCQRLRRNHFWTQKRPNKLLALPNSAASESVTKQSCGAADQASETHHQMIIQPGYIAAWRTG